MSHLMTIEEQKMFDAGKRFYHDNKTSQRIFYRPLNEVFPFLFKTKIEEFDKKVEFYLDKSYELSKRFNHLIAYAYATGNYTKNSFSHYHFNVGGKIEVFGYLELEMFGIIDASKKIVQELSEKSKINNTPDNVVQFKRPLSQ